MLIPDADNNSQILKEIIANSWNGIGIIDLESNFIYVNDAFTPILGYSSGELLKNNLESLMLDKYQTEFKELLQNNAASEYANNIQVGCLRKDKEVVYLDISIKQMSNKNFFVININDVTKNISDHETFDKYVIQLHVDINGIINKVSEAFCRLSLYTHEELIGSSYKIFLFDEINEKGLLNQIWDDIKNIQQFKGVLSSKNKNGAIFWVDIIIKPIKNKYGDITGYSAVMFDITSELNLQKNTVVLKETILNNEEKLKIMSETMRTVAHEWRQPLNTISLDAQNLLISYQIMNEPVEKEEAVPILQSMQKNIEGLSGIISKFQYITEFKSDKKEIILNDIIHKSLSASYAKKDFVEFIPSIDIKINTYDEALVQSIVSILDNAQDAIDKLDLSSNKFIQVVQKQNKNEIRIEISNNGGNIPDEIFEKVFTPYFSTKETKNGVGLSLYVAKMIIEFHLKGKIELMNKANNIVLFSIILPIRG